MKSRSKKTTARSSLTLLTAVIVLSGCYTDFHSDPSTDGPSRDQAGGEAQSTKPDLVGSSVDGAVNAPIDAPSSSGGAVGYDGGGGTDGRSNGVDAAGGTVSTGGILGTGGTSISTIPDAGNSDLAGDAFVTDAPNPCQTNNGGCDPLTTCTNTVAGRTCGACPSGYSGTGAMGCTDINECLTNNGGCDPHATCTNTPGSHTCGPCASGYHDDGTGTCVANVFISGPCVTSPDLSSIEIFASSGQKIYRRVISGASSGSWMSLANLDATKLDARSDLDCNSNSNTVHIVASGTSPTGSYMHATGFGTSYNAFTRELSANSPSTFGYIGVSIAAWPNSTDLQYAMAAVPASGTPTWATFDGTTYGAFFPTVDYALLSAPDIAYQRATGDNPNRVEMVAFTANGMVYFDEYSGRGGGWDPNTYWPPPASTTYSYSPSLCNHSDNTTIDFRRYVAAVAGGRLYSAYSDFDEINGSMSAFSAWALAGSAVPASSPDCVVTSDNTLHIVVLTSTGTIAHLYRTGVSGSWSTQDLGAF